MAKKLWGGRFTKSIDPIFEEFSKSIHYDYKLAQCDLLGSIVHVEVLKRAKYLKPSEANKLTMGLKAILAKVEKGAFVIDRNEEDIHTQIQNMLLKSCGGTALKLQTARSRNDQVAFASKLYSKFSLIEVSDLLEGLIESLKKLGNKYSDVILPGFTHMQHAQPVLFKDYVGAYGEMFDRDADKIAFLFEAIKLSMGSGALAGTPIDAKCYTVKGTAYLKGYGPAALGFDVSATTNALDVVSDRDFVVDILSALSVVAMHISRLSEDLILWSTKEFNFVDIDEAYCTGSSLMPQKKNADSLELMRGYAGRIYGALMSVLTMMKGLPLSYNRDMQLDKEPLFNSLEVVSSELKIMTGVVGTLKIYKDKVTSHLNDESLYATDLIYYLVGLGMPFKTAHTLIGKLVKYSIDNGVDIKAMDENELKAILGEKVSKREIVKYFDPLFSVKMKRSIKRKAR